MHPNSKGQFTYYLNKARNRKRRDWAPSDLDEEYLAELWEKQDGKCAWSGLPIQIQDYKGADNHFTAASLDRVVNDLGYVKGNVQFVLRPLNLARCRTTDRDMKNFLTRLRESVTTTSHT